MRSPPLSRRSFLHRGAGAAAAFAGAPMLFTSEELRALLERERPDLEVALRAWRWIEARTSSVRAARMPRRNDPLRAATVAPT